MNGLINFYKESGMTSMQAVSKIRRKLGVKSAGHMGTLDPTADGVLLVGIGKGTRLFNYFLNKQKEYIAEFTFGYTTDTLDSTGTTTGTTAFIPDTKMIESKLPLLTGSISQIPPAYSAKHIDGKRSYDLARQGIEVSLKACDVEIYDFRLLSMQEPAKCRFSIRCSGGTYIRSLARDLGELCGSLCIMSALTRTCCGPFGIADSCTLESLTDDSIISFDDALSGLPKVALADSLYNKISNGVDCEADGLPESDFLLYCKGDFFGIAENQNGLAHIKIYLKD